RDVVHRHLDADVLDGDNPKPRLVLDRIAVDRALSCCRWVHGVEEPKMLLHSAGHTHSSYTVLALRLDNEWQAEATQAQREVLDDLDVLVADPQDSAAIAALCVEDPGKESLDPVETGTI